MLSAKSHKLMSLLEMSVFIWCCCPFWFTFREMEWPPQGTVFSDPCLWTGAPTVFSFHHYQSPGQNGCLEWCQRVIKVGTFWLQDFPYPLLRPILFGLQMLILNPFGRCCGSATSDSGNLMMTWFRFLMIPAFCSRLSILGHCCWIYVQPTYQTYECFI